MPSTTPNKFIDNPYQKTVTAVYQDRSKIVIPTGIYNAFMHIILCNTL